jgi:hypothetical protein
MYNFIDVEEKANQFRRGFLNSGLGEREDPTYLAFSIDFITEPVFYQGLRLYNSPLFIDENSDTSYSAIKYLINRDRRREAEMLREFKKLLVYISQSTPWFFQSISGLKDLWQASTNTNNPYKGSQKELQIECLEAIDLRMTYLADLYRKAVFDEVYMREKLPQNLRYFECDVYIHEFRNIRSIVEALDDVGGTLSRREAVGITPPEDLITELNQNVSTFKFRNMFCEFDFSESVNSFDSANVHTPEMASSYFKIRPNYWIEQPDFRMFDIPTSDGFAETGTNNDFLRNQVSEYKRSAGYYFSPLRTAVNSLETTANRIKDRAERVLPNIYGQIEDSVQENVIGDSLGNVYDYGITDFINSSVEQITNAIDNFADRATDGVPTLGDIYGVFDSSGAPTTTSDISEDGEIGDVY